MWRMATRLDTAALKEAKQFQLFATKFLTSKKNFDKKVKYFFA
jgi:hypothetical protein